MRCPYCASVDTRVIDSRLGDGGECVRRRRECQACEERFTTFEQVVLQMPRVIKSDGSREKFSEDKLRRGMTRALEKRPIDTEAVEGATQPRDAAIHPQGRAGDRDPGYRRSGDA